MEFNGLLGYQVANHFLFGLGHVLMTTVSPKVVKEEKPKNMPKAYQSQTNEMKNFHPQKYWNIIVFCW